MGRSVLRTVVQKYQSQRETGETHLETGHARISPLMAKFEAATMHPLRYSQEPYGMVKWHLEREPACDPDVEPLAIGYLDLSLGPYDWVSILRQPVSQFGCEFATDYGRELAEEFVEGVADGIRSRGCKWLLKGNVSLHTLRLAFRDVLADVPRYAFPDATNFDTRFNQLVTFKLEIPGNRRSPHSLYFAWFDNPLIPGMSGLADEVNVRNDHSGCLGAAHVRFDNHQDVPWEFATLEEARQLVLEAAPDCHEGGSRVSFSLRDK